jgi:hypothetical protein
LGLGLGSGLRARARAKVRARVRVRVRVIREGGHTIEEDKVTNGSVLVARRPRPTSARRGGS